MRKAFLILCISLIFLIPVLASANSLESYDFDDSFFSGSYSPEWYVQAELHFIWNTNDFGGKIFLQDFKTIPLTQLDMDGGGQLYCTKQVRGFYINTARGNRVRPLDQDSLAYLQSVDSSYNNLSMIGGLYICGLVDNGVYGYIQHIWSGESYTLVAGADYDFFHNAFITGYWSYPATFLFENMMSSGYIWDNYGGIAQLSGAGLDVIYACGDATIDPGETCDDGEKNGSLHYCNLMCNGLTTSICGNSIIEIQAGEACDDGPLNGLPGHCNLACTTIIPLPSGGGGGGSLLTKDVCPATRDCSSSYYDSLCGPCILPTPVGVHSVAPLLSGEIEDSPYSQELTDAYQRAYSVGITTVSIEDANLTGTLLRKYAAKMISQFAINVLHKQANDLFVCSFPDMAKESLEMQYYARLSCKLRIMGLQSNGSPDTKFNPNEKVTRAQFGTILSRLLYGDTYNGQPGKRYEAHLQALKAANIMTKISQPMMFELRGWVMLMLQRISK